jgi:hypothetical protein
LTSRVLQHEHWNAPSLVVVTSVIARQVGHQPTSRLQAMHRLLSKKSWLPQVQVKERMKHFLSGFLGDQ